MYLGLQHNSTAHHFHIPMSLPSTLTTLFFSFSFLLLLHANGGDSTSGMDAKELSALYEVLGALLDDPSWPQLHPHPCTDTPWPGVQCETLPQQQQQQPDPFYHVTKLHVGPDLATPPCRPGAELSLSLLRLPFLKTLSIFGCFVGATVTLIPPPLFSSASSLEQLVLISNRGLSGPIPTTISLAGRLSVLRLSQNDLRGEIPRGVGGLRELKQLDLSYNRLTGGIPEELGGLAGLGILDLSFNGLRGGIPRSLGRLRSLQKLDLGSNSLSGRIPEETGMLRKLVLLDLSRNSITGPVPEALSGLEELEYFLVENNPIGSGVPLFLGALGKLVVVGLSGCGLSGPIPSWFESLSNLTALALDRNRLSGSVPRSLDALGKLGQLNLSQNMLSGEIAFREDFVSRLGKRLDVRDNKGLCANSHLYFDTPPCGSSSLDATSSARTSTNGSSSAGAEPGAQQVSGRPPAEDNGQESLSSPLGSSLCWYLYLGIYAILVFL